MTMMINKGFDIHGVLTSNSSYFRKELNSLLRGGNNVHIITGSPYEKAIEELTYSGFKKGIHYTHFFSILDYHKSIGTHITYIDGKPFIDDELWNSCKAQYCKEHNIDLHVDDSDVYGDYFSTPYSKYDSKGRRDRVAILGGAFDPVTNMHKEIATYLLETGKCDLVWFLPCYISLHGKSMTESNIRIKMLRAALLDRDDMIACDYEIRNKLSGKTYDMMVSMIERFKHFDFKFVIGQDNAEGISNWYRGSEIIKDFNFIVIPRKGIEAAQDWYMDSRHVYCEDADISMGSSTIVRDIVNTQTDNEILKYVDTSVLDIIRREGLYI